MSLVWVGDLINHKYWLVATRIYWIDARVRWGTDGVLMPPGVKRLGPLGGVPSMACDDVFLKRPALTYVLSLLLQ